MGKYHIPVMLQEVLEFLSPREGGIYVDCTLGEGGHTKRILEHGVARIIGIDEDYEMIERARENLSEFVNKVIFVNDNFRNLDKILGHNNIKSIDGILYDLGTSSYHLETASRGFSFLLNGPLDMRFNKRQKVKASTLINSLAENDLVRLIWGYGEDRYAKRIAKGIVEGRARRSIETTFQLVDVINSSLPKDYKPNIHPATRTFQALRIAVNNELEAIEVSLKKSFPFLKLGSRIVVISFHSLEDRIVKSTFLAFKERGQIITKRPITPTQKEIAMNPRARSAKLRCFERK
ncbi:MAG: 16S rRNA (cytosine(1402)-N(4))-methyltransferase RsmH [bacterium]|nr:16S rRNA (cytosine(1402)-N(4))-methyltransferase RsmH [bacterium]